MKFLSGLMVLLTVIGGINWGLVGLGGFLGGNWNVVNLLLGSWPTIELVIYLLIGISALVVGYAHLTRHCTMCEHSS